LPEDVTLLLDVIIIMLNSSVHIASDCTVGLVRSNTLGSTLNA